MPGPAPKPANTRRRRNATPPTMKLPAAGRDGAPPRWPLDGKPPRCWRELWALPQAVAWERMHLTRVVARYARVLEVAETGERYALAETRQIEDRLGLTPMALMRLRWEIGEPDDDAKTGDDVPNIGEYRDAV